MLVFYRPSPATEGFCKLPILENTRQQMIVGLRKSQKCLRELS